MAKVFARPHGMQTLRDVQAYWDRYPCGIQVSQREVGTREFFEEIKAKFRETYGAYAHSDDLLNFRGYLGKSVLEIGCGIGLDALEFAKNGADVTAIDLSPRNIELARKYFAYNGLRATIEVGNAEALRFADNTFDLVVAIGVLYYTPNTETAVEEILRVLKPQGKAICMFFNRYSWYTLLAGISRTNLDHEHGDPPILKLYSAREARELFAKFSSVAVVMHRFPTTTIKRSGVLARLYNYGVVPVSRLIPRALIRPFGFHIVVQATK
jgi:ubiquinone/menaquinone biosynthesis C-methylase UbiE